LRVEHGRQPSEQHAQRIRAEQSVCKSLLSGLPAQSVTAYTAYTAYQVVDFAAILGRPARRAHVIVDLLG
jgi:hypothetical protein